MTVLELELERVAHGGFVVARADEKVVFVTGGLPGEFVRAEVVSRAKRFDRARVVEVLRPSPGRVVPPCPIAEECGGCDWQHASPELQLELKTAVVAEQLERLAGIAWDGSVQSVGSAVGSRTRMRYAVDEEGRVGLRGRRSHDVVALPEQGCLVAADGPRTAELRRLGAGRSELQVVNADGRLTVLADGRPVVGSRTVTQRVRGRDYRVSASGFWQVHPSAAELLTGAVLEGLGPRPGETALDLYCGVGPFAGALADRGCDVLGIELSREAINHARRNVPEARFLAAPLAGALDAFPAAADLVVLDPPRKGAGSEVVTAIAGLGARAVAYVACDPAALARDLATFAALGYHPDSIEAWDLFPMTHHVECVAILRR
ncbi:class I SAM-dependent RNA methyltransferase [Tessaracoccus sp. OS52]|uniref:class I SAM-dependent RNA methyltransferase n=1 Tax=Tessaracoccus sp. OS52 TaxID=2886691 RepID=UPI001D10BF13|nr:class I SAM-dependent RNA methyltransferase [Tessaracoccus sp. OS52]MCC2592829.1 class I SAM-dependent RNA methyltransferase [Tessaracoccus sp. OS52]